MESRNRFTRYPVHCIVADLVSIALDQDGRGYLNGDDIACIIRTASDLEAGRTEPYTDYLKEILDDSGDPDGTIEELMQDIEALKKEEA